MSDELNALAPHVDRRWREDFTLEQRLLGVPGDRIGEALLTVESHVLDSGETAEEAFGDPRAYARAVTGPTPSEPGPLSGRFLVSLLAGLLGLALVPRGVGALLDGGGVTVTSGDLWVLVLLLCLTGLVVMAPGRVVRALADHPVLAGIGYALVTGVMVAIYLVDRDAVSEVAWWFCVMVGGVALVVSVLCALPEHVGQGADRVRDGRQGQPSSAGVFEWVTALLFPLATLLVIGVGFLVR